MIKKYEGVRCDTNKTITGQLIHKDYRTFIGHGEVQLCAELGEDYVIVKDCYEVIPATVQPIDL